MISSKLSFLSLALLSVALAFPQATKNVEPSDTAGNTKSLIATAVSLNLFFLKLKGTICFACSGISH